MRNDTVIVYLENCLVSMKTSQAFKSCLSIYLSAFTFKMLQDGNNWHT